jgi:alpha-galactosidase
VQFDEASDVLAKPLSNGDVAVVLYNKGEATKKIKTTAYLVGLRGAKSLKIKDLVSKAVTSSNGDIEATVPSHGSVIYRITAQ